MQYNYISAGAGAGKTEWAIKTSVKFNYGGQNVLFIVPTIDLANSIEKRSGGLIKAIHNENSYFPVDVVREIFTQQAKTGVAPGSWVITEACFLLLGSFRFNCAAWVVIKDEALEPLTFTKLSVPDSLRDIDRWFNFLELSSGKPTDKLFRAIGIGMSCPVTTSEYDSIYGCIHILKEHIKNPYTEVIVNHTRLEGDSPELAYSVFQKPELYEEFGEVYFMSANFEDTFLYTMWRDAGVDWCDRTPPSIQGLSVAPSSRVRIHYWLEDKGWSDKLRNKTIGGITYLQAYFDWFNSREPGVDYVYSINNKYKIRLRGEIMPAVCHGLNDWNHFTKFMTCASYLINGGDEPTYQYYGSSTTDGRGLRQTQMIYQQLMRTDIRNYESDKPVDLYLPTRQEALDLLLYLPDATLMDCHKIKPGEATGITGTLKPDWLIEYNIEDSEQPLPVQYMYGDNVSDLELKVIPLHGNWEKYAPGAENGKLHDPLLAQITHGNSLNTMVPLGQQRTWGRGGHNKKRRSHPFLDAIRRRELQAPISVPEAWKLPKDKRDKLKANLPFFCTGQYAEGDRITIKNCVGNNDIIAFDIDKQEITKLQISKIFTGIEYLTYTTMSSNPADTKRSIRIVIPCSRTMTLTEHSKIMNFYVRKLEKIIVVDKSKITPWSKFYWPHIECDIEHVYKNKTFLDVDCILAEIPREPVIKPPTLMDINMHYPPGKEDQYSKKKIVECMDILNKMVQGDRTNKALSIAGKMKNLPQDDKLKLYDLIVAKGVDSNTLKTVKKFANI